MSKKIVIIISSHPDDAELAAGGTIAFFVELGFEVWVIYMTKGRNGGISEDSTERVEESIEACITLGVDRDKIFFGPFHDTRIADSSIEALNFLESFYLKNPKNVHSVFIPSWHDIHQDHRTVGSVCRTAFRKVPCMFAYESPSTTEEFKPKLFIDITKFIKVKWNALRFHRSQIRQNKAYMTYEKVMSMSSYWGSKNGLKYAEGFEVIRFLMGPGLWPLTKFP